MYGRTGDRQFYGTAAGGAIRLEEVPVAQRAPILKACLGRAPGARPHIRVDKDAALSEFEKIAADIPVFRILSNGNTH